MDDLFKKLNTLIRANLGEVPNIHLPRLQRSVDLDKQVEDLRKKVNEALEYEDTLQATVHNLRAEAEKLDAEADAAIQRGMDDQARRLLDQLKRTEQRLAMAESDLREHQRAVEDLIKRVNQLDATVADNKATAQQQPPAPRQESAPAQPAEPGRVQIHVERDDDETNDHSLILKRPAAPKPEAPTAGDIPPESESKLEKISGMIREAQDKTRERIQEMDELIRAQAKTQQPADPPAAASPPPPPTNTAAPKVETPPPTPKKDGDDIQRRIDRLSKR